MCQYSENRKFTDKEIAITEITEIMLTTTCTILVLIIRFTLIIRNQHPPQYYRPTECPTRSLLNLRPANTKPQASDKDYQPLLSSIYQAYQVIHGASSFTSTTLLSTSPKMTAASSGHNLRGRGSSKKTSNAAADDLMNIRSSIMSHITLKMCQFGLIIYLRDYHYGFYLDIYVLWSFYGVFRLTYTTFQNLCPTDHFFGRLLMSQDISPNWMVLLEFTYRIIQKFFRIFPMSNIVLFPMYVSYRF